MVNYTDKKRYIDIIRNRTQTINITKDIFRYINKTIYHDKWFNKTRWIDQIRWKNQRLGEWGLGQTKALFIYDEEQYNKERRELEQDTLIEVKMRRKDDVTDMNREIYALDEVQEMDISRRIDAEVFALNTIAEDDDMGDDDDQVRLDYGDL